MYGAVLQQRLLFSKVATPLTRVPVMILEIFLSKKVGDFDSNSIQFVKIEGLQN
jgi:hypothetical protein